MVTQKPRQSSILKRLAMLLTSIVFLMSGTIQASHAQADSASKCLLLYTSPTSTTRVNVRTGSEVSIGDTSNEYDDYIGNAPNERVSPDAHLIAYTHVKRRDASGHNIETVRIKTLATGHFIEIPGDIVAHGLGGEGIESYFMWSPDSTQLAYAAADSGGMALWIINVKSHHVNEIRNIQADQDYIMTPGSSDYGSWSPDSQFFAFDIYGKNYEQFLKFWSASTGTYTNFVAARSERSNDQEGGVWSAKGHQFAFIGGKLTDPSISDSLLIVNPDTGSVQSFLLDTDAPSNIVNGNVLRWSSDNTHIAYVYIPNTLTGLAWKLDIAGLDGKWFPQVATISPGNTWFADTWTWSPDGSSVLFMTNQAKSELRSFSLHDKTSHLLLSDAQAFYQLSATRLLGVWQDGHTFNVDAMSWDGKNRQAVLQNIGQVVNQIPLRGDPPLLGLVSVTPVEGQPSIGIKLRAKWPPERVKGDRWRAIYGGAS